MDTVALIKAVLGLDRAPFTRDLNAAVQDSETASNRMAGGNQRVSTSHENLLRSNHRVATQFQHFSRDLLSGADAAQVFESALVGLERSLNLPLGALAGLAVGGIAVQQIGKVREEYEKLYKEVDKVIGAARNPVEFRMLADIEAHAKEATAALGKLREQQTAVDRGGTGGLWQRFKDYIGGGAGPYGSLESLRREKSIGQIKGQQSLDAEDFARKYSQTLGINEQKGRVPDSFIEALKAFSENLEKQGKYLTPGSPDENQLMADPLRRELELAFREIAEKISQARRERLQGTLGEIAARPKDYGTDRSIQSTYEGSQAREAQKEIEAARQARESIGGEAGLQQAQVHMSRADEIKAGISSLKDSEKDPVGAFRGALDSSQILKQIEENTKRQFSFKY